MRILLTGALGFTGHHFDKQAKQNGHEVLPLSANVLDAAAIEREVDQIGHVDAVVHLAALAFVGHAHDAEMYAINTVGTSNLLAALSKRPAKDRPGRLLIASSANVYGNCAQSPIAETQPPAPVNHYAASKLAMEHMALAHLDRLPVVITRPFNYTGPGQAPSFLIPKLVDHFARRAPVIELGNLHVEREFNDVRMVTEAYLRLLDAGEPGQIYNVCSGLPYSLHAVLERLTRLTDHRPEFRMNPNFVRANEVHRLCGDPTKLKRCLGTLPSHTLEECLSLMLGQSPQPSLLQSR